MATWQYKLVDAPTAPQARQLWLQQAAGFIIIEDVRRYAMEQIDPALPASARAAVQKGIDHAVYGLMMVIEGVSGGLTNVRQTVSIDFIARLTTQNTSGDEVVLAEIDLQHGDGMCAGFHGWLKGDFGEHPVTVPNRPSP